ncbi:hypothetical protein DAEQUDRAFT_762161 [Daedalea quercina L-15889]|uniref:Methyltransferase domain-containing protein n=1 Tax=Daedalea quercina L-15889 TaxID=1314783 RepID=A0A165TC95_9APHY|nr:hypothetical protein DAEQUDRAFT_762161 [Daedalea quercina L-15889]
MRFSKEFKRTPSTPDVFDRPLPPLPPSPSSPCASPPRLANERRHMGSLLSRSNSVNSEDTLWTATSSSISPTRIKKRLWERSNSFTFGRKSRRHSRHSSLADDATVVSLDDIDTLCGGSSVEKAASDDTTSVVSDSDPRNFEDINKTVERYGMPYHPFKFEDVPYLQAYSSTALDSDNHTFELLLRLNPKSNSPTFHDYGRRPPKNVLDLGCGEGRWVLYAARAWKSAGAHVTGIDLIDLHSNKAGRVWRDREADAPPRNVTFVRGNFVKYHLPFPDGNFDLVRLANLGLVIPFWTWEFLLSEVWRVLTPGGRLELVEDQLLFPRIPTVEEVRGHEVSSPTDEDVSPKRIFTTRRAPGTRRQSAPTAHSQPRSPGNGHKRSQSDIEYEASRRTAEGLEKMFREMLPRKYGYALNIREHLESIMQRLFRADREGMLLHEFRLGVPPRESVDNGVGQESAKRPIRRARYSESDIPMPLGSPRIRSFDSRSKALRVLVGDDEALGPRRTPRPYQPPGLVLVPSLDKLLPFSPVELEMHACKNMHVLLSCKGALTKYLLEQTDENGEPLFSEDEISDFLFDYDQFRRKRFNWPMDYPGLRMDEDLVESSPRPPLLRLGSHTPSLYGREGFPPTSSSPRKSRFGRDAIERAIEVRTIRVYNVTKPADDLSTMFVS